MPPFDLMFLSNHARSYNPIATYEQVEEVGMVSLILFNIFFSFLDINAFAAWASLKEKFVIVQHHLM